LYEEVSRAPNHFSVVLFLRRCKSTAEKKAKQSLSHNSPEKPTILGKIGHFLGKIGALLGKMLNEIKITSKREKKELNLLHKNIKNALKMLYTF